jgi:hypothetical protein
MFNGQLNFGVKMILKTNFPEMRSQIIFYPDPLKNFLLPRSTFAPPTFLTIQVWIFFFCGSFYPPPHTAILQIDLCNVEFSLFTLLAFFCANRTEYQRKLWHQKSLVVLLLPPP